MEESVDSLTQSSGEEVNPPQTSVKKQKIQLNIVKNEPILTENAPPPTPKPAAGISPTQGPIPFDESQTIYTGEGEEESDLDIWCDTFSSKSGSSSESQATQGGGGDKPRVAVPVTKCRQLWKPWRRALILKVLDHPQYICSFNALQRKILDLWSCSKGCELTQMDNGYMIARFYSRADYEQVLEKKNGPWMITKTKHYLTVAKWRPYFEPSHEKALAEPIFSTLIWVRVPKLLVEFFTEDILLEIGNVLGKAIKIDDTSSEALLKGYSRICVDIDFTKPLVPFVVVNGEDVEVEYVGLDIKDICKDCHKYGNGYGRYHHYGCKNGNQSNNISFGSIWFGGGAAGVETGN